MQLRLTRFDGLRLSLARGWYVAPSYVRRQRVGRLIDVLLCGLGGISDVVELEWSEWENLAPALGPTTFVYLSVPGQDKTAMEIAALVADRNVRFGLIHLPDSRCWPNPAWDELEVKSALVSWFLEQFSRPDHPLAGFGIARFPLDLVAGATADPIELIDLIQRAIDSTPLDRSEPVRWSDRAMHSIGSTLADLVMEIRRPPESAGSQPTIARGSRGLRGPGGPTIATARDHRLRPPPPRE